MAVSFDFRFSPPEALPHYSSLPRLFTHADDLHGTLAQRSRLCYHRVSFTSKAWISEYDDGSAGIRERSREGLVVSHRFYVHPLLLPMQYDLSRANLVLTSAEFLGLTGSFRFLFSVDLFVRESNDLAIGLYQSLGYMIYRRVVGYYGGGPKEPDEDAFGKSLLLGLCPTH